MSYDVIVSSFYCTDEYPNNNGCDFTNTLNQPLDIDEPNETWAVALREITYEPNFWQQMREGFNECEIRLRDFDVYVSKFKMMEAQVLYFSKNTVFPVDPNNPFTA